MFPEAAETFGIAGLVMLAKKFWGKLATAVKEDRREVGGKLFFLQETDSMNHLQVEGQRTDEVRSILHRIHLPLPYSHALESHIDKLLWNLQVLMSLTT